MQAEPNRPLQQAARITIIDSVRGFALLGILMMNISYFAGPHHYTFNLQVRNELSGANYYTWWVVEGFFEGTMRALFSMLFGAGALLLLQRLEGREKALSAADICYRRLLWLLLFGLFNAYVLLWPGDILYGYALCGLFLFPFRHLKAKHLALIALGFLLCATAKQTYQGYQAYSTVQEGKAAAQLQATGAKLNDEQQAALEQWKGYRQRHNLAAIRKEAAAEQQQVGGQGYLGVLSYMKGINAMLESKKFYHIMFFDIMYLLFAGMALYKWRVLTGERSKRFYWTLLLTGYCIGLPLSVWEHYQHLYARFDPAQTFARMPVNIYQLRRTLLALGHLSVLMLLYRYGVAAYLLRILSRVGQMAFTNYLMQSIICTLLFYGYGFGLYGTLQRYQWYYVVGAVWVFQIIFSQVWLHYFRFGPFEWAWRSLTYWQRQPMRRSDKSEPPQQAVQAPSIVPAGSTVQAG